MGHRQTHTPQRYRGTRPPGALVLRSVLWRGMLSVKQMDSRQLEYLTVAPPAFYLSAFLKMLTALSASAALSKAK
jgi:hypothetical protein